MSLSVLITAAAAVWVVSCVASALALRWNFTGTARRLPAALVCSCLALAIGYFGISRIQFSASKTVNGQVLWSINSRWFFIAALLLGAVSLGVTLWNWRKGRPASSRSFIQQP